MRPPFQNRYTMMVLTIYIPLKIFSLLLLIYFFPILTARDYFLYSDLETYANCDTFVANFLYSQLICKFGITELNSSLSIILSLAITFCKDLLFIAIASRMLQRGPLNLFIGLIAVHPYLGLYSGKLTSDVFACLAIALIYTRLLSKSHILAHDIAAIVLTGFRNSLFFLYFLLYSIIKCRGYLYDGRSQQDHEKISTTRYSLIILAMFGLCFLSPEYLQQYFNGYKQLPLSYEYFRQLYLSILSFGNSINIVGSHIFSLIFTPLVHFCFLLGAREGAYTHFPNFLLLDNLESYITVFFFLLFFTLHAIGLASFIAKNIKKNKMLLLPMLLLIPNLYLVSHLRYFLPFIPIALIGICLYFNQEN